MVFYAPKLKKNDTIRVIAPALSLSIIGDTNIELAKQRLENQGYTISFAEHCFEKDHFNSSSIQSRIRDIHAAFYDKQVQAILTAIGGFNSNQLLPFIDFELIKQNPKILCGFSDITALANAIFARTGLVTYSGLHFSTFAMQKEFEYNQEYFDKCLVNCEPYEVIASPSFSDDAWYIHQEQRKILPNHGFWSINHGTASGTIVGGNLSTLALLFGTKYMPSLKDTIVFLEDDELTKEDTGVTFDDKLHSLMQQPDADCIRGIVIGRFQLQSEISRDKIEFMIRSNPKLTHIPIIANVDFGHTNPLVTFPIGGTARISVEEDSVTIVISEH